MSRIGVLTLVLLAADQASKAAAHWLAGDAGGAVAGWWGVIHRVDPGLWARTDASAVWIVAAHAAVVGLWVVAVRLALRQRRARGFGPRHRGGSHPALRVDLFVALLTTAVFGALLDRLLVGGSREWLVTPFGVTSLSDLSLWVAAAMMVAAAWGLLRQAVSRRRRPVDVALPAGRFGQRR